MNHMARYYTLFYNNEVKSLDNLQEINPAHRSKLGLHDRVIRNDFF